MFKSVALFLQHGIFGEAYIKFQSKLFQNAKRKDRLQGWYTGAWE